MALPIGTKVRVIYPKDLQGRVGYINGEQFKYPSQNFWVTPVVIDGKNHLVTSYEEWNPPPKPEYRSLDDQWEA